jgi:hypothetical protein
MLQLLVRLSHNRAKSGRKLNGFWAAAQLPKAIFFSAGPKFSPKFRKISFFPAQSANMLAPNILTQLAFELPLINPTSHHRISFVSLLLFCFCYHLIDHSFQVQPIRNPTIASLYVSLAMTS